MSATPFCIRTYGRTELALLYNPHLTPSSAWRVLRSWININPPLRRQLKHLGLKPTTRRYTPAMVSAIVKYLGEP